MPGTRSLLRGAAEFVLVLALLLAPWPGLDRAFSGAFSRSANALGFERRLDSGTLMRLEAPSEADLAARAHGGWHAMLRVANETTGKATRLAFNTRATTYVPLAALMAFLVAVRAWRRERPLLGIATGALMTLTFSGLALALASARFLALPRVGALRLEPTQQALVDTLFLGVIVPPGMAYVVPLLAGCFTLWLSRERGPARPFAWREHLRAWAVRTSSSK